MVTKDQWSVSLLWKSFVQYTDLWSKGTGGWLVLSNCKFDLDMVIAYHVYGSVSNQPFNLQV